MSNYGVRVSGGGEASKRVLRTKQRDAEVSKQENCEAPLTAAVPSVVFDDISPHRGESPSEQGDLRLRGG